MRTLFTITAAVVVFANTIFASNYNEAMKTNIEKMRQAHTSAVFTELAGSFQRIANAEHDKWLPGYYVAYCYVNATFFDDPDAKEKHRLLDLAQAETEKVLKRAPGESEIYALQAFIYQLRITDMSKGYKYSKLAGEAINKAHDLNPENPRVYYLRGSNTFHTPKMFGGGAKKAKPDLQKAVELFEGQAAKNEIAPDWGEAHAKQLLKQCDE